MLGRTGAIVALALLGATPHAQAPRPFPVPGQPPAQPARPAPATTPPGLANDVPTEAVLGVPVFPNAQFITSYDAGRNQRYFLFGAGAPFVDVVNYYRTVLKQKGTELFESPPTHQFDIGRFREESMAFPPSVTVKDYTWGGSAGYPNPKKSGQPERFATVIQVVPSPPGFKE